MASGLVRQMGYPKGLFECQATRWGQGIQVIYSTAEQGKPNTNFLYLATLTSKI
jgi:hypothetical protein